MKTEKEYPTISIINGWAFGLTDEGRTICLGKEADVQKALANPKQRSANHSINDIIDRERELMKQQKSATMPVSMPSKSSRKGKDKDKATIRHLRIKKTKRKDGKIPKMGKRIPKVGKGGK